MIASPERLLPGGYLYMTDILGDPLIVQRAGRLFASAFADKPVDVVMTVATKGIPLAYLCRQLPQRARCDRKT